MVKSPSDYIRGARNKLSKRREKSRKRKKKAKKALRVGKIKQEAFDAKVEAGALKDELAEGSAGTAARVGKRAASGASEAASKTASGAGDALDKFEESGDGGGFGDGGLDPLVADPDDDDDAGLDAAIDDGALDPVDGGGSGGPQLDDFEDGGGGPSIDEFDDGGEMDIGTDDLDANLADID